MDLDRADLRTEQGITKGDTGVSEGSAVDDEAIDLGGGEFGDFIDEGAFVIALEEGDLRVGGERFTKFGFEVG